MTTGFIDNRDLDMQSYKDSLKTYLRTQPLFKDYDFDGPNMSVLLDILAYNAFHNGLYLNMVGSEMFMDTAQLRDSIVSHAKELNYVPRSRSSAVVYCDVQVVPTDSPDTVTIPRYYRITGRDLAGRSFYFSTNEPIILTRSNNYATTEPVPFYEGLILTDAFEVSGDATQKFVLASQAIDISSLDVSVQVSRSDTTTSTWQRSTTLFDIDSDSEVFFVEGSSNYRYELQFGGGVLGKALVQGNLVFARYRQTLGDLGNGIRSFSAPVAIEGYSDITLTPQVGDDDLPVGSFGGALEEGTEDIRFTAPRYFATQERAVNASDYITLVRDRFPSLQSVIAYGGEEATPKQYGKVIVSAKPYNTDFIPSSMKTQIIDFLKTKASLAIETVVVDPEYVYLDIASNVKYNVNVTASSRNQMTATVRDAILEFNTAALSNFGSDLRFSKLTAAIDDSDNAIVSNDTTVRVCKRLVPTPGQAYTTAFSFENELLSTGTTRYEIGEGEESIIDSSPFVYEGVNARIQDNGVGVLRVYTTTSAGRQVILERSIGTVDYDTGTIAITNLIIDELIGDNIKLYARTEASDIETVSNKILLIDEEDVSLNLIGVRV